jgi:hypothetical protein
MKIHKRARFKWYQSASICNKFYFFSFYVEDLDDIIIYFDSY